MKWISIFFSLFLSTTTLFAANPFNEQEFDKEMPVLGLLAQPIVQQQFCAEAGYIGYQNALAARYLNDRYYLSFVRAYAWGLVAYSQILHLHNAKLIEKQKQTLQFIRKNMSQSQLIRAEELAQNYIKTYSKSWPAASAQLKMKNYPRPCRIVIISATDPR